MKHSKTIIIAMIPALVWILGAGQAAGQSNITEIIDVNGDGMRNSLDSPRAIAVDGAGKAKKWCQEELLGFDATMASESTAKLAGGGQSTDRAG